MPKRKEPELTPDTLAALKGASGRADALWCVKCGQVRLADPAERTLEEGDDHWTEALEMGTPQQCIDAIMGHRADA